PSTATWCPAAHGRTPRCATATRSKSSRPCKEDEMTDSEVLSQAAAPWAGDEPWTVAGRELSSRLILGTGGVPSLDVLRRAAAAAGAVLATVAMRRVAPAGTGT